MAIVNSYLVHKKYSGKYSHKEYRFKLIEQLLILSGCKVEGVKEKKGSEMETEEEKGEEEKVEKEVKVKEKRKSR